MPIICLHLHNEHVADDLEGKIMNSSGLVFVNLGTILDFREKKMLNNAGFELHYISEDRLDAFMFKLLNKNVLNFVEGLTVFSSAVEDKAIKNMGAMCAQRIKHAYNKPQRLTLIGRAEKDLITLEKARDLAEKLVDYRIDLANDSEKGTMSWIIRHLL